MNNDLFADLLSGSSSKSTKKDVQTLGELHKSNKVTPNQTGQLDLDFLDTYVSKPSQAPSNFSDLLQLDQSSKPLATPNPTPVRSAADSAVNLLDGDFDLLSEHSSSYAAASPKLASPPPPPPPAKPEKVLKQKFETAKPAINSSIRDEALAELIDMGFPITIANNALDSTSNGHDLNEAISYLMEEAHSNSDQRSTTVRNQDADFGSIVNNLSNDLFNKASFLLNNSRKKLLVGLESYKREQIEKNDGKPLWMKNAEKYKNHQNTIHDVEGDDEQYANFTQEVPKQAPRKTQHFTNNVSLLDEFDEPTVTMRPARNGQVKSLNSKLTPSDSSADISRNEVSTNPPTYHITFPLLDANQTSRLNGYRTEAGTSFQNGDYPKAIEYYTQSLAILPALHPLKVMFYSNLALVYSKLGNPKCQLELSTQGMDFICTLLSTKNPDVNELAKVEIELSKNLRTFWVKMLTKKAEALDLLERWTEAKQLYEELISIGECTKSILDGKSRCVKALSASSSKKTTIAKKQTKTVESKIPSKVQKEAVDKIRKDNIVNAQIESQKFQLHDQIGIQLDNWRKGNEHNIRALICSLDKILWNELNWKPIKLTDLVLDKKVKISYMKAVSKVHPDKIPNDTSIERKMIAEGVFITLNQAWEDWKQTN